MLDAVIICMIVLVAISYLLYINRNMILQKGRDGHNYLVRDMDDKEKATDTLVVLRKKLIDLIDYIDIKMDHSTDPNFLKYKENIKQIKSKLPSVVIRETSPYTNHTSFSVNKGQELNFCIRSKTTDDLHNINDLLYVAIHEIAHIGCPEIGHTKLFYDINVFLLKEALEFNIYQYANYDTMPIEYCGIKLNHSVLN